jgi:hypothetical protein
MATKRGPKGITPDQYATALRETFGNVSMAARKLGVDRMSVVNAMGRHASVKQAHDEAAEQITDIAEGHLIAGVRRGEWKQVQYWLEAKARHKGYGRVYELHNTHSAPDGGPVQISVFNHSAVAAALTAGSAEDPEDGRDD